MKRLLFLFVLLAYFLSCSSQEASLRYNLNFEQQTMLRSIPDNWIPQGEYLLQKDSQVVHSGKYSLLITSNDKGEFGSVAYALPANYNGKTVTLEAYMKLEGVEGTAGLLIGLMGEQSPIAYVDMRDQNIQGTKDWEKYSIEIPLEPKTLIIHVAGMLTGKGKIWLDDFRVTIDGKDIQTLEPSERAKPPATLDTLFLQGPGMQFEEIGNAEIQNLYVLGKVWGFMKYYHPVVGKGLYNWDNALFRIVPAISEKDFKDRLADWVREIEAPVIADKSGGGEQPVKLTAETDWVKDEKSLSEKLTQLLEPLITAEREKGHYYVEFASGVGNPVFTGERSYSEMDWEDDGVKLLALFRYWNMIEYFFPYRHLMDEDWEQILRDFIPKMIAADTELDYKLTLLELIGKVQDTHANIWQNDPVLNHFRGERALPLEVNLVEGKAVVVRLFDDLPDDSKITAGDVITAINDRPVEDLVGERLKYAPASNRPTQLRDIGRRLLWTNDHSLRLELENEEGTFPEEVPAINSGAFLSQLQRKDIPSHKVLEGDIGYIYPASLKKGEIVTIMEDFQDKKGLILDFRCYPSDFIVFSLGKYLMPEPTEFVKFTSTSTEAPGRFTFGEPLKVGEQREDYFRGKVVILINESTQSSAEYHVMALRRAPQAVVIGSTTAGADGNVSRIVLPGSVQTMISGIGVYYPDGTETQRVGIVPDIELRPTIASIRAGRDEVLERAVAEIVE
jgi:C-terminal processing protease CtpA/Prc